MHRSALPRRRSAEPTCTSSKANTPSRQTFIGHEPAGIIEKPGNSVQRYEESQRDVTP